MDTPLTMLHVALVTCIFVLTSALNISPDGNAIKGVQSKKLDLFKRHLDWIDSRTIFPNLRIDFLQPHPKNVPVDETKVYMAFNLYLRRGQVMPPNTGIFHFIDLYTAQTQGMTCPRRTNHAGAYKYFYGVCPQQEENGSLVASGYCYQPNNGLVFRSNTFNDGSLNYLNGTFYLNTDRTAHAYEQRLITACYNSWKDTGFSTSWRYMYSTQSQGFSAAPLTQTSDVGCDALLVNKSERNSVSWIFVLFVSAVLKGI